MSTTSETKIDKAREWVGIWLALGSVVLFMFLPLFAIYEYGARTGTGAQQGAESVGIAVLLRATARRLIRTGASNILRTTFGAFSRAAARTFTRRLVRIVAHSMVGVMTKTAVRESFEEDEGESGETAPTQAAATAGRRQSLPVALLLGFVGLAASFWGVIEIARGRSPEGPAEVAAILGDGALSLPLAATLAAFPVVVFGMLAYIGGRIFRITIHYNTALDGLLLQAYFTGAGSFLPMTTDMEYFGESKRKMRTAAFAILGTYMVHLILVFAASDRGAAALGITQAQAQILQFSSAMFLIYCFIYSFPIKPLEGHDVWSENKLIWVAIWIPILISFLKSMPEQLSTIL